MYPQLINRDNYRELLSFPPCFPELPYEIAEVLSYNDTTQPGHRGIVYQQSGFHLVRENSAGLQTYARAVRKLSPNEDAYVQYFAERSLRSRRYRSLRKSAQEAGQLWLPEGAGSSYPLLP